MLDTWEGGWDSGASCWTLLVSGRGIEPENIENHQQPGEPTQVVTSIGPIARVTFSGLKM